ncbi:MAG: tetratricopeptide repeat-containing sulfotransferase family protein [Gammaproteobacteria bacterium]
MATPGTPGELTEIHRLMGEASAAFGRGDLAGAGKLCSRVLAIQGGFPDALHLAGLCAMGAGDLPQAVTLLTRAMSLKPNDPQLAHNAGIALAESGDSAGARAAFARAAALDPANPESQFNLAVTSEEAGDVEQAEAAYRRSLTLAPRNAAAAAGLAALCEQRSDLTEAARWCGTALALDAADPVARLTAAQLDFRAGRDSDAAGTLEALLSTDLTARNRALAAGRLGAVYDRLHRSADAWRMFLGAKSALQQTRQPAYLEQGGSYSLAAASRVTRHLDALLPAPQVPAGDETAPVFLVGFPRSGTTLLDQILSGHPGITVLEERDTLQDSLHQYVQTDSSMQVFLRAGAPALAEDRRLYWRRVEGFMPLRPLDRLFVDKLPLNTLFLPMLARLFPAAKFIFALRDPRDVVLSCFMQTFALNEAMRHFLTLEQTADFYAAVMELGRRSLAALPARIHLVRYEDVVADTEGETRRLLEFLGLPWDAQVLDIQATARRRRINTPSYHQVARPIYGEARERWRRYAAELEPVMGKLERFVKAFGYN